MQIQQALQNVLGVANPIPAQIITELVAGQQLDAVVVKAALAAQIASIKVADTLLDIRTPVPLQQGQAVQIELSEVAGKPVLKLVPSGELTQTSRIAPASLPVLNPGQLLAVEVVKILNNNRLIVETRSSELGTTQAKIAPQQFDIDISKLTKQFTIGEKAQLEIISTKPLTIELKAQPVLREQAIVDRIKQLLPQLAAKPDLAALNQAVKTLSLPRSVEQGIRNLLNNIVDKQSVSQPQALKQAIQQSGSFTEKQLLLQSTSLGQDFKANILKVLGALEGELSRNTKTGLGNGSQSSRSPAVVSEPASQLANSVLKTDSNKLQSTLGRSVRAPQVLANTTTTTTPASTQTQAGTGQVQTSSDSVKATSSSNVSASQQSLSLRNVAGDANQLAQKPEMTTAQRNQGQQEVRRNSSALENVIRNSVTSNTTGAARATTNALPPLSALVQASAFQNASATLSTVLASPPSSSLTAGFTPFLDSVLTSPAQALAMAKTLSQTMSPEQSRGLQMELVVLQSLLKEVEGLHARVQLNQFSMLKEPDVLTAPSASWIFDIPLKDKQDIDFLQLQIDQHASEDEKDDDIWNVQLRLDTQNLGPVQATVTMYAQDIKIILRAERPESAELLQEHIAFLDEALSKLGVSISHVSCVCGEVSKSLLAERYLTETNSLVDISV